MYLPETDHIIDWFGAVRNKFGDDTVSFDGRTMEVWKVMTEACIRFNTIQFECDDYKQRCDKETAEWIEKQEQRSYGLMNVIRCSKCNDWHVKGMSDAPKYCSNCGRRMTNA